MKSTTVECDACHANITTTTNSNGFRIVVRDERIPSEGGAVTDFYNEIAFGRDLHFCNENCMRTFFVTRWT